MFNEYIWQLYLNAGGKNVVQTFENNFANYTNDYSEFICRLHKEYCPSNTINTQIKEHLSTEVIQDLYEYMNGSLFEEGEYTIITALQYIYENKLFEENENEQSVFSYFADFIETFTTCFTAELPELFVPYYFKYNFNVFEKIAQEFNIILPKIPGKKDYLGRFYYYGDICNALYDFRTEHNMTPYELCAFLYDFAPKYIGGIDSYIVNNDLPAPKGAYFIGGHKDDSFLSDDSDIITPWQCNPDTRAGDMIVMYLRSPISAIDSIWRSVSIGFNDPFFYYYRCTYIANPVKVKNISQKKLQSDSVFKQLPIVKKNMQGINGVELYPSVYNHLLDIAKSNLPKFDFAIDNSYSDLKREKDVEDKLVKPFLEKLGFFENDYVQQLQIRVGNHNFKLIPDFVINPNVSNGHHSAQYHIEVKFSIPNLKFLEDVKIQARSYAKQLGTFYSVIASKEGIWISEKADDYTNDILSFSWKELNNEDIFYEVFKILGKGK